MMLTNPQNNAKGGAYAMKSDNLRKVKDTAAVFLETQIRTRKVPLSNGTELEIVDHPFFNNRVVPFPEDTEQPFRDILSDAGALQKAIQIQKKFIEESDSAAAILLLMNKPYRLQFLEIIQSGLSLGEMGELLSVIWADSECPNKDAVPLSTLVEWFKNADKELLMDADELVVYNSLPDEFTVYRGIGSKSNKDGISYTLSQETAEWFANRFPEKNGYVLTETAKKKDVLAYFNGREEQEILIAPENIANLHKM